MKEFIKRIFCHHNYIFHRNGINRYKEADFGGGGYNTWEERYTEYICTKCGKTKKVFDL